MPLGLDQELDLSKFEIRPFIHTPSDFYTAFRVVTGPSGDPIAGGLYYSGHSKKGEPRRIVNDRISYTRPGSIIHYIRTSLEDPDTSPYFLNATDVRSNVDCGGSVIALMGDSRRLPTDEERGILRAHNIDPDKSAVPERLVEIASYVGRTLGPHVNLLIATDFLVSADLADGGCCEVNTSPGDVLYEACYPETTGSGDSTAFAMRKHVLENLARM